MFKRILGSKAASIILDAIGIFSLASFLFLGFYLRFIVDILPSCYFTDALIVYVECGKGIIGGSLKFYFQFFSPLIVWIAPLLVYGLFTSFTHFVLSKFLMTLLMSSIILISIGASFRIIYKILKRLTWKKAAYSEKERLTASLLLLMAAVHLFSIRLWLRY